LVEAVADDFERSLACICRARAVTELQRASLARGMDGMSMNEIDGADTRRVTKRSITFRRPSKK
jgi:hypothetical protein